MTEPDYIVIRAAADLPPEIMPPRLDGWWFDRATIREGHGRVPGGHEVVAVPADRFEVREDGAVAQVWEITP